MRGNPSPVGRTGPPVRLSTVQTLLAALVHSLAIVGVALAVLYPAMSVAFGAGAVTAWAVRLAVRRVTLTRDPTSRSARLRVPFTDLTVEL